MKVLIDTCVWSQVLRRQLPQKKLSEKVSELIHDGRVAVIGPIRQELLSGLSNKKHFNRLKDALSAFEDTPLKTDHFEKAAEMSNTCRKKGIQGSTIDFLICAVAHIEDFMIFTTDKDFAAYKKHIPIRLIKF